MTVRNYGAPHQDPPALDEARLVDEAKSGDPEAFATLYDACVERVSRYVYFRVTDDCDMEDLVSQVFLRAWEFLDRYKTGSSPFIAWLYTIARNLVIDHHRTKKKDLPLEEAATVPSDLEMPDDMAQMHFDLEPILLTSAYLARGQGARLSPAFRRRVRNRTMQQGTLRSGGRCQGYPR